MRRAALFYGAARLVTQKVKHMTSSTSTPTLEQVTAQQRAVDWANSGVIADLKEFATLSFLAIRVDTHYAVEFPGLNAIAQKTKMSTRSVSRAIASMLERGVIAKDFQYIRLGVDVDVLPAPERKRRITYIGRGDHGLSKKKRLGILERDGHTCLKCGAVDDLTVDHIYPWALGGSNEPENLRTLCRSCNSMKGTKIEVRG